MSDLHRAGPTRSVSLQRQTVELIADFENKTVEVEPALPPVNDPTKNSLDNYKHTAALPADERMSLYKVPYDKLVCAVGCYSADFGIPGVGHS